MINLKQLSEFLVKAKKSGYAAGNRVKKIKEKDKSKTIIFKDGDWKYHDNYFGSKPFGGREVVFFKNQPVYMMIYYGSVNKSIKDYKKVYKFLRDALILIPKDKPFRGPKKYVQSDYIYINKFKGKIDNFSGIEIITIKRRKIYRAKYIGGLVGQR
jgi:hypothetical protein